MTETQLIDFHNHLIPGVDDGAVDDAEAVAALHAFADQDVLTIIATPHVQGSLGAAEMAERLAEIDAGWARLVELGLRQFPQLALHRGAEVMLDTPRPELTDERLRLDGGSFVLVEFPFMAVPPNSAGAIQAIAAGGLVPIVAHPERYSGVTPESQLPAQWRGSGALLQINAGSLTGRYGPQARANALALLERGVVDYLCSDYHARGRPSTQAARKILVEMDAAEQADLLTAVNPRRLLAGERPIPVPQLRIRKGFMGKLKEWLR